MNPQQLVAATCIVSGLLFIFSIAGLNRPETAKRGTALGVVGMAMAMAAAMIELTAGEPSRATYLLLAGAVLAGTVIGAIYAFTVKMTGMPGLVALFNSFGGLASALVGFNSYLEHSDSGAAHLTEVFLGTMIGVVTFTGSIVAWAKLSEKSWARQVLLPGRNWINLGLLLASSGLGYWFVNSADGALLPLLTMSVLMAVFGIHLVLAIGGADMPVVVSILNAYSGLAATFAGFMLNSDVLIVTGTLVGSSGLILSYLMCRGMNRSFLSVILGGFGQLTTTVAIDGVDGVVTEIVPAKVAELLVNAENVIITPGYGMAVAQAQHPVAQLTRLLRGFGSEVRFAVHPVAGRMPGHMNVLLAEAQVPYDLVFEMDEINDDFATADVVLVIGANDTVNPAAATPGTPISGMPVLRVWEAKQVIVFKRGRGAGYAGVPNPLFYADNTAMCFGDAAQTIQAINAALPGV
ncbi:MAG: NAD(P)(+) transhydrogenase (Re/Si-specific) subunit beta [Propionibacteriaceae bacterium]|jgi:NAD(P) transhydrogenase subunit beta|nr:NAD(P)(+) transhydrogenase (Re/Si-specific) subunit beta [Propionibacteriaceae bacterium]